MKKIPFFILIIVFSYFFSGCEKDDICDPDTPTTPRLVIQFYDINNPTVEKSVTNLKVIGEGMTEGIIFEPLASGESKYLSNAKSISIPLKTNDIKTTYSFILNSGSSNPLFVNTDKITFNYTTIDEYVSRACGFKTVFEMSPSNSFVHTDGTVADSKWMKFIQLQKTSITTENEIHLSIFF